MEVPDRNLREELQSMWKVPSIAQFVSLFRFSLKLPELEIEDLEDGILHEGEVGFKILNDLLLALIKGIRSHVNEDNWEVHLERIIEKHWFSEVGTQNPLGEKTFHDGDLKAKVEILYFLCCLRLNRLDVQEEMKGMDAETLRVQPLGCDDSGNEYWYFYGTRLYKQEPAKEPKNKNWEQEWNKQKEKSFTKRGRGRPRKEQLRKSDGDSDDFEDVDSGRGGYMNIDEKSRWSVVCNTIEDWVDFAEKFKNSKSKSEKALFLTVKDNFLPVLNDIYQEKERRLQKKLQELIPRNKIVTRRVTQKEIIKAIKTRNFDDNEDLNNDSYKDHLRRDRARRLEERNRRSSAGNSPVRSRSRSRIYEDSDGDDEDEEYIPPRSNKNVSTSQADIDNYVDRILPQSNKNVSTSQADADNYVDKILPQINTGCQDFKSKLIRLLSQVKLHKDAWPFLLPVEESYAPRYFNIIREPMDLSTINSKIFENKYKTVKDIDADFDKMVKNCRIYNGNDSDVSKMAVNLWRIFRTGMRKILGLSDTENQQPATPKKENSGNTEAVQVTKCSLTNSLKQSKHKKKDSRKKSHIEALENLSKESEKAVQRVLKSTQENSLKPQKHRNGLFSDLKVVPTNSHPQSLIDQFSSDSSNRDLDSSPDNSFHSNSSPISKPCHDEDGHFSEDSTGLSELINKNDPKGFNILSDGEDVTMLNDSVEDMEDDSKNNLEKDASETSENLVPAIENILEEECPNENVSNLISGLTHENLYPGEDQNPSNKDSRSSVPSSPSSDNENKASQSLESTFIPSVMDRSPLLQEDLSIHPPELDSLADNNEPSTVDASVLGITQNPMSYKTVSENSADLNSVSFTNSQSSPIAEKASFQSYNTAFTVNDSLLKSKPVFSFPTSQEEYISSASTYNQDSVFTSEYYSLSSKTRAQTTLTSAPQSSYPPHYDNFIPTTVPNVAPQIPIQVSALFPNSSHQNGHIARPEANKFPHMKLNLTPSSGNIMLVPENPDSSSMTFHLYAEQKNDPTRPIQSHAVIRKDGSVQILESDVKENLREQNPLSPANKQPNKETVIRSPKRTSPLQVTPPIISSPSALLNSQIGTTGIHLSPQSSSNVVASSNMHLNAVSTSSVIRPNTTLIKPALSVNSENFVPRFTETNLPNGSSFQSAPSRTMPSIMPYYSTQANGPQMSSKVPVMSVSQQPQSAPKVFVPNGVPQFHPSNVMPNGNGQFVFMVPQDTVKRMTSGQKVSAGEFGKAMPGVNGGTLVYPNGNTTMIPNYGFPSSQINPSQIYAQVTSSQIPQYVNYPQYMVADQSILQNAMRYPLVNAQPFSYTNRAPVPMDIGSR